jgi:Xaa-Pro aminopeptidase
MAADHGTYGGDEALERLLAEAGSGYGSAEVRDLLSGVLAAPPGEDPDRWMRLVAEPHPDALSAQLRALKDELAASAETQGAAVADRGARLALLRAELARRELDGFLVPHADEHQGEYLPPRSHRLAWLTGFTGSAGLAVVLGDRAVIFVDGRYTLQVRAQVDEALFQPRHLIDQPPHSWLEENLSDGLRLGYDPWLHTRDQVAGLEKAAAKAGAALIPCPDNPLDHVWADQPPPPIAPIEPHGDDYAGRSSAEKRLELGQELAKQGADSAVLTMPDSIAWLLNLRGADVSHTPLPLSFALLAADGTVDWFVDRRKLAPGLEAHLGNGVALHPPEALGERLDDLGGAGRPVLADPATAAAWIFQRLEAAGARVVEGADPCQLPKAKKNPVELDGIRAAHRRDGAALTNFLAWLDRTAALRAGDDGVSEIEAMDQLAWFRRQDPLFRDLSFDTISGSGPNGAIVHYRATEASNRRLGRGELFLVDSGAQYPDGTTDVTRTVAIGGPSQEMRERFTLVLKGHIALATQRFPRGTTGSQLDTLARAALWQAGLDFDHGTGHGVGHYLGVHEGPQRISKAPNKVPLEPGMVVSNEPGYYKTGAYGIRIENLVTVVESEKHDGEEREMLCFETLTLAPIDLNLVEPSLLNARETAWLDGYHARVRETLVPLVDGATAQWLIHATQAVGD